MHTMTKKEILAGIELTASLDSDYADTLRGARTRGSTTKHGLEELPEDYVATLDEDQSCAGPGTAIYRGGDGVLGGKLGILGLAEALERGFTVSAVRGEHGPELVAKPAGLISHGSLWSSRLTFIVATEENKEVPAGALVTWYPGRVTPLLGFNVAVKILPMI